MVKSVIIVLNAVVIVLETERRAILATSKVQHKDIQREEVYFGIAAIIFCALFIIDLTMHLYGERWHFFQTREWKWNVFDMFVTITAAAEVVVQVYQFVNVSTASLHVSIFLRKFT